MLTASNVGLGSSCIASLLRLVRRPVLLSADHLTPDWLELPLTDFPAEGVAPRIRLPGTGTTLIESSPPLFGLVTLHLAWMVCPPGG